MTATVTQIFYLSVVIAVVVISRQLQAIALLLAESKTASKVNTDRIVNHTSRINDALKDELRSMNRAASKLVEDIDLH